MTMEIFNHESAEVYGCGWIVTILKNWRSIWPKLFWQWVKKSVRVTA